jgi:uncharacterized protein (DUF427 family)
VKWDQHVLWVNDPRYYIPIADIHPDVLVDEQRAERLSR